MKKLLVNITEDIALTVSPTRYDLPIIWRYVATEDGSLTVWAETEEGEELVMVPTGGAQYGPAGTTQPEE